MPLLYYVNYGLSFLERTVRRIAPYLEKAPLCEYAERWHPFLADATKADTRQMMQNTYEGGIATSGVAGSM